ncbi:MAG: ankyrin repeat domain-containing protein [Rickettsiaceae bacterium]|nr:ankyrin repeat domain-containing protein [Rickettsiaceae bacterium]
MPPKKTKKHHAKSNNNSQKQKQSVDLDYKIDSYGNTPLIQASYKGDYESILDYIDSSSIDAVNDQGCSALIVALEVGNKEIASTLIQNGANVNLSTNSIFLTAMELSVSDMLSLNKSSKLSAQTQDNQGMNEFIRSWQARCYMMNDKFFPVALSSDHGYSPLRLALEKGYIDIAQIIVDKGGDINALTASETPLMWAIKEGNYSIVKWLLGRGADDSSFNEFGYSAIKLANQIADNNIIELLQDESLKCSASKIIGQPIAKIIPQKYAYRLIKAIEVGNLKQIKAFVKEDPGIVNAINRHADSCLLIAVANKQIKVVNYLIDKGAKLGVVGQDDFSPLMLAVSVGSFDIVKILTDSGAQINFYNNSYGVTALMLASSLNDALIVKFLLENKADTEIEDRDGDSPLLLAVSKGYFEVVKLLVKFGANIYFKNKNGHTAIDLAMDSANPHIKKFMYLKHVVAESCLDKIEPSDENIRDDLGCLGEVEIEELD